MSDARGARIAFIIDGALEQRTGGYLYDAIVIEGLRAAGAEVRVVSLPGGGPRAELAANGRVVSELSSDRHDVVVIDELSHPRATAPVLLARARWRKRPRVVTLVHHLAASERSGLRRLGRLAVERALIAASDRVIATSETTERLLRRLGVSKARLAVARPGRDRLGERRSSPPAGPAVRFLFLGALTPRKDPRTALEAFARVEGPARLTLIGPTDRDRLCAAEARGFAAEIAARTNEPDRVVLAGELDDASVAAALDAHDVLVMPSRYEGFGIAAAEAMSHGLAVFAARVGGLPEVVGDAGAWFEPGDAPALAAIMTRAVCDRGWLEEAKARALARAAELGRWRDTVDAFRRALFDLPEDTETRARRGA